MKILLTGATGFVGSAVLRALRRRGYPVRVLVRAGSDRRNLVGEDPEIATGDLTDTMSLQRAMRGCTALFHVAADYRLWAPDAEAMHRANVAGTRALMQVAADAGVQRVVYTSSVATLGVGHTVADESTPVDIQDMIGPYKQSKFLAEAEVRAMATAGLPVVIVNPSTPVGPRDIKPTPTGRIIRDAACGRIPAYVDTGLNIVHVDDVAEGHCLAFERGTIGARYILGGENLSLREILTIIAGLVGRRPPRVRLSPTLLWPVAWAAETWVRARGHGLPLVTRDELHMAQRHMFFSSARAERELGYRFRPAREALADAVRWFDG